MAKKVKVSAADGKNHLISFKLANEPFTELERYAKDQVDEMGNELSPSQAARRLMLEALKRHQQKKS